jgi:putative heme degradation protein
MKGLTATGATLETRAFLKANGFAGLARVGGSRTDLPQFRGDAKTIRTVVHVEPDAREDVIQRAWTKLGDVEHVHRLDRDDKVARYCAIAIVRRVTS